MNSKRQMFDHARTLRIAAVAGALLLLGLAAHAATINVPADHDTIQAAIDAATTGDTIIVGAGTYRENVVWDNKDLTIIGAGMDNTVINGDVDGDGTSDGRCMTMTNLHSTSSINGFSFADGAASAPSPNGGGIYMNLADVFVANCEVRDCTAEGAGGGIWLYNSSDAVFDGLSIHDCTATNWGGGIYAALGPEVITVCEIDANQANYGGGIYLAGVATGTTVDNSYIHDNQATSDGGGVLLNETYATFYKNTISANIADRGGAMYLVHSSATIRSNLIHHNLCMTFPAGISCLNSPATIEGNTIADNDDGGLSNGNTIAVAALIVRNNILYGNLSADLAGVNLNSTYNTIGTGLTAGTGNITSNPLFVDAANGDYHLQSAHGRWNGVTWVRDSVSSPAIDAGDPASPFENEMQPNGGRRNMGAYGNTAGASLTGDGQTPFVDGVSITPDPAYTDDTLTAVPGTWFDPNGDPEGYNFQWALWDGVSWQNIPGQTAGDLGPANFAEGDTVRVTCWPNDGTNVGAPVTASITISGPPGVPTGAQIVPINDTTDMQVNWQDNSSNEDGFEIQRRHWLPGGTWSAWTLVTTSGPDVTQFIDDQLPFGSSYQYRVRAVSSHGNSDWALSNAVRCEPTPLWPVDLTANPSASQQEVDLAWVDKSAVEEGFTVQRRKHNVDGSWSDWATVASLGETDREQWTDDTISVSGVFEYRVNALNTNGPSEWSLSTRVRSELPNAPPAAPSRLGVVAINDSTAIRVTWQDNSDNETSFKVERRRWLPAGAWSAWETRLWTAPSVTGFTDDQLPFGSSYQYRVRAVNSDGPSDWATSLGVRCEPTPLWPVNVQAEPRNADADILVTWESKSAKETYLKVERRKEMGQPDVWSDWQTIVWLGGGTTQHLDSNIAEDGKYQYRVRVFNDAGPSEYSLPVTILRQAQGGQPAAAIVSSMNVQQVGSQVVSVVYSLTAEADVTLEVRNIAGRVVATVPVGVATAGVNTATWNLRNTSGAPVPSGMYLCTIVVYGEEGSRSSAVRTVSVMR